MPNSAGYRSMPCPTCYVREGEMCVDNDGKSTRAVHTQRGVIHDAVVLNRDYLPLGPGERQKMFREMISRYRSVIFPKDTTSRGNGKTARAILNCPRGAVFVWCNHNRQHAIKVAEHLMRQDVTIVTPDWIADGKWHGIRKAVRFDHSLGAAQSLSERHWSAYEALKAYLRAHDLDG